MRKINLLIGIGLAIAISINAQKPEQKKNNPSKNPAEQIPEKFSNKKYPSLLWEITGNGLPKPSYLFGTMHVSDKLAFHLGDSFYHAIKNVQTVALETNPEFWQDDYSSSVFFNRGSSSLDYYYFDRSRFPMDNMRITSFAIDKYDEAIKAALAVEPSLINGLLYRTYGNRLDDFEEDTYVDMYIFQTGKKLGKKLTGVENFQESEKLVMEAYKDMYKDRNKKKKSFEFEDFFGNPKKVEDAYRKGDLDQLDSLDALTVMSDAFQEKFLYRRNEIQANSIDTILKKSSLFVAVGAAHLPGRRGVIELLRAKGYTVRPVKMDDRNSVEKDMIDKMRAPVTFTPQNSEDGFYRVNIPGKKFYRFTDWSGIDVVQYADMINGAYYVVTRVKTNSSFQGDSLNLVVKKIDTLLYENIPGKILKKTPITLNGYRGWEIFNRTRRGDNQQYNIFVTPFEVVIFKMSGNGEYVKAGTEAKQFFGSIRLTEFNENKWTNYTPPTGGFSVELPHQPLLLKDDNYGADRLEYSAFDKVDKNSYLIMKMNIHNYGFAEEDSFDLNLMDESYGYSSFIDRQLSHHFTKVSGYPALQSRWQHKDGSYSSVKYVIRGPVYYAAVVHYKNENPNVEKFLQSFTIKPFVFPEEKLRSDTSLHMTVMSPFYPTEKKQSENIMNMYRRFYMEGDGEDEEEDYPDLKTKFIGNDTIGEKIFVTYKSPGKYFFVKDSVKFWKNLFNEKKFLEESIDDDDSTFKSTFITRLDTMYNLPSGIKCRELQLTDTGSSRLIWTKWLYKDGHLFTINTLTDTLDINSSFLKRFYSTLAPADSLKGEQIFTRKTEKFFNDFFSTDSVVAKKARRSLNQMEYDSLDVPLLKKAVYWMNWDMKNYLETKEHFISELSDLNDSTICDFFRDLYFKVGDTSELQNAILGALLSAKTKKSFATFKDLILKEPPITDEGPSNYHRGRYSPYSIIIRSPILNRYDYDFDSDYDYGSWSDLYDTLELTKTIFPDFLQMMNLDEYKSNVISLMTALVDSGLLKAPDYESYFNKIYMDARQILKKQIAKEDEHNIDVTTRKKDKYYDEEDEEDDVLDNGNSSLEDYSVILMPFYDRENVRTFFAQLLKSRDQELLYHSFMLMLRNKKPVPDSLFLFFAKNIEYRLKLYVDLQKIKMLDKFPAVYKNQLDMARCMLRTSQYYSYSKPDSVVFLDKLPVTYKGKTGWVYFFKYKKMRDDNYWEIASVGMQPQKVDSIDVDNDEFTEGGNHRLENNKPLAGQLQNTLKEMLNAKRSSASEFYEARNLSRYKDYLSEMVKSERYRD